MEVRSPPPEPVHRDTAASVSGRCSLTSWSHSRQKSPTGDVVRLVTRSRPTPAVGRSVSGGAGRLRGPITPVDHPAAWLTVSPVSYRWHVLPPFKASSGAGALAHLEGHGDELWKVGEHRGYPVPIVAHRVLAPLSWALGPFFCNRRPETKRAWTSHGMAELPSTCCRVRLRGAVNGGHSLAERTLGAVKVPEDGYPLRNSSWAC